MEYIREMLLRQRTALARLMLGAGGRDTAEASSAPAHAGETDLPESGAGRRTAASGGRENARHRTHRRCNGGRLRFSCVYCAASPSIRTSFSMRNGGVVSCPQPVSYFAMR